MTDYAEEYHNYAGDETYPDNAGEQVHPENEAHPENEVADAEDLLKAQNEDADEDELEEEFELDGAAFTETKVNAASPSDTDVAFTNDQKTREQLQATLDYETKTASVQLSKVKTFGRLSTHLREISSRARSDADKAVISNSSEAPRLNAIAEAAEEAVVKAIENEAQALKLYMQSADKITALKQSLSIALSPVATVFVPQHIKDAAAKADTNAAVERAILAAIASYKL